MTSSPDLRALAGENTAPPFGFEQFEQRRAAARHRSRVAGWSAAAALGVLAIVPVLAFVTQPPPAAHVIAPPAGAPRVPLADLFSQPPALVDMERFAVTSELEDYIALLDAQISAARLTPVAGEDLRRLEKTREELNDSLQRVAHAHALLDL